MLLNIRIAGCAFFFVFVSTHGAAISQNMPRQFSNKKVETSTLEICQSGPERRGAFGRQVAQVMMDLGWSKIRSGDPYSAAEAFISAANAGPERPDSYWGLGVAAHVAGMPDAHLQACFGRAQTLLPDEPGPWADHGRALDERGKTSEAIARLLESLKRDPDFMAAHIGLAKAYDELGEHEKAIVHARRVQELTRSR